MPEVASKALVATVGSCNPVTLLRRTEVSQQRAAVGHSRPRHRAPPPSPFPLRSESDRKCLAQNRLKFGLADSRSNQEIATGEMAQNSLGAVLNGG